MTYNFFINIVAEINKKSTRYQAATDGHKLHLLLRDGKPHLYGTNKKPFWIADLNGVRKGIMAATFVAEYTSHMQLTALIHKIREDHGFDIRNV